MGPTTLFYDNQSAISLRKEHCYHARTKHIDKDIILYGGSLKKVPYSLSIIFLRIIWFTICEGQAFLNGTRTRYSLRGSVGYPVQSCAAPVLTMSRLTHLFLGTLTN